MSLWPVNCLIFLIGIVIGFQGMNAYDSGRGQIERSPDPPPCTELQTRLEAALAEQERLETQINYLHASALEDAVAEEIEPETLK